MSKKIFFVGLIIFCKSLVAQDWSLLGNAGTVAGTNFIGTTDAVPLLLKVNNIQAGYINNSDVKLQTIFGYEACLNLTPVGNSAFGFRALKNVSTGINNTAIGGNCLLSNTTGGSNSALGQSALKANTTGSYNAAFGGSALLFNTTGGYNAAFGISALRTNTVGSSNSSFGNFSLYSNVSGYSNVAIGRSAMYRSTIANNMVAVGDSALFNQVIGDSITNLDTGVFLYYEFGNTALGSKTLYANKSGSNNTATGKSALYSNISGSNNVANGATALQKNTTGDRNVAVGFGALYSNSTGNSNVAIGSESLNQNFSGIENIAIGGSTLFNNINGKQNVGVGVEVLNNNSTGNYNAGVGTYALAKNSSQSFNNAFGWNAGSYFTTSGCTFMGHKAASSVNGISQSIAIGYLSTVSASYQVRLGSSSSTSIGGQVGWTTLSDKRFKKDVKGNVPGLEFINKLTPVTYHLDATKMSEFLNETKSKDNHDSEEKELYLKGIKEKEQIVYTGFLAQDVEKAATSINYDFSGVDAPKNANDYYGIRYAEFVVPLVKAVQELSKENEELKMRLQNIEILLANTLDKSSVKNQIVNFNDGLLEQNVPNPFTKNTTISYALPLKTTNAKLIITDKTGKTLKEISLVGSGKGTLVIDANTLSSGAYMYSLLIDGKIVNTKQMILAK